MRTPQKRKQIRNQLPSVIDAIDPHELPDVKNYIDFYGIGFENTPGLDHYIGRFEAAGFDIVMQRYQLQSALGTVFLFHGYYDHAGIYHHAIEFCLKQGYSVVIYDLPGHGLSSGDQAAIDDFAHYQEVLQACLGLCKGRMPKPWHVIAQSTGCGIISEFLLSKQLNQLTSPFDEIVYFAPLVKPVNWRVNSAVYHLVSPFTDYIERKFAVNSNDYEFLKFLREDDPLQSQRLSARWVGSLIPWIERLEKYKPVNLSPLIFQGDDDGTVDYRYNLPVMQEKFNNPEIVMLQGARHQLVNEAQHYRNQMFSRIAERFRHSQAASTA